MEEMPYLITKQFVACPSPFFFLFHCRSHFSISYRSYKNVMWFFHHNSFLLLFISRCSSFSVIRFSVDIKI